MSEATRILNRAQQGHAKAAEELLTLVYDDLRQLATAKMAHERPGQTLQPTALVHEAWLRLAGSDPSSWQNRAHFFAAAAEAMRRILIDRARKRQVRAAAGLDAPARLEESRIEWKVPESELIALHEVLDRLAVIDAEAAKLVKLRYFVGLDMSEAANVLGTSRRQAERLWTFAKAWLRDAIRRER